MANQPDIVVMDKQVQNAPVVDVEIVNGSNIREKEQDKIRRYSRVKEEL